MVKQDKTEKLNGIFKYNIDNSLKSLNGKNIKYIYAGRTEQPLVDRLKQHVKEDSRFRHMTVKLVVSSSKETQVKQIELGEEYFIKELKTMFPNQCINVNDNSVGQQPNKGDNHKLYMMYCCYEED